MYAEAILEDDGDVDLAIEYIDKVRERAGVVKLKDYITENNGFSLNCGSLNLQIITQTLR